MLLFLNSAQNGVLDLEYRFSSLSVSKLIIENIRISSI